jgi:hypothetical protein
MPRGGLELRSELVVQSPPNGRNADGAERSCGRQPAAEDFIRSERHPRARSFEQLLRRGDPLGHGAHSYRPRLQALHQITVHPSGSCLIAAHLLVHSHTTPAQAASPHRSS